MSDSGGSQSTKTMIGRVRSIDDNEKEKNSFKFVVPLDHEISEVCERLPVKNLFICVNFDVFMLN